MSVVEVKLAAFSCFNIFEFCSISQKIQVVNYVNEPLGIDLFPHSTAKPLFRY